MKYSYGILLTCSALQSFDDLSTNRLKRTLHYLDGGKRVYCFANTIVGPKCRLQRTGLLERISRPRSCVSIITLEDIIALAEAQAVPICKMFKH